VFVDIGDREDLTENPIEAEIPLLFRVSFDQLVERLELYV
jgi:hypothetical protein